MLKRIVAYFSIFLMFATASASQTPEYKVMGRIDVMIDGETYELVIPWETARKRGGAKISKRLSTQIIDVSSVNLSGDGSWRNPRLSISFTVSKGGTQGGLPVLVSMELSDEQGFAMPAVANLEHGSIILSDLELDGKESVAVSFSGELVREDRTDILNMKLVEGAAPVSVIGSLKTFFSEPD